MLYVYKTYTSVYEIIKQSTIRKFIVSLIMICYILKVCVEIHNTIYRFLLVISGYESTEFRHLITVAICYITPLSRKHTKQQYYGAVSTKSSTQRSTWSFINSSI